MDLSRGLGDVYKRQACPIRKAHFTSRISPLRTQRHRRRPKKILIHK
jgi:hypothetical protein